MKPKRVFSKAPWESKVGYCRAIKSGQTICVTGTVAIDDDGNPFGVGNPYAQAKRALELIESALTKLGTTRADIVRTRMFVTDIKFWEEFGRAHAEFFKDHPPATSMLEIKALINPAFMIEIEADAVVQT